MAPGRPIAGAVLALLLWGCQGTVILNPPKPDPAPEPASREVSATNTLPAEAAPAETSSETSSEPVNAQPVTAQPVNAQPVNAQPAPPFSPASPVPTLDTSAATETLPPASAVPVSAGGGRVPGSAGAATSVPSPVSFMDRVRSGLRTGTVGAAFGSVGGPIGLAAGGGAGFMAGFVAGRPLFGGSGPRGRAGSWDQEVADQQTWEAEVAARAEQLESGDQPPATGMTPAQQAPGTGPDSRDPARAEAGTDPVQSYEAWAAQVLEGAQSPSEGPPASEAAPEAEQAGDGEMPGEAP